jgi:peptide subunit release factor 1 (eRF1)
LSRNHHNWNQIHKALLQLGFESVSEEDGLLVYKRRNVEVVLEKSNNIDRLIIEEICNNIGESYDVFVESYRNKYMRETKR